MRYILISFFILAAAVLSANSEDSVDLNVVYKIKQEAFQNGKVMDHLFQLTDVHGPRLSGSPEFLDAAQWAVNELKSWGIENAHLEPWGPFGRSWSLKHFSAHLTTPRYTPLLAYPRAWTAGTSGTIHAEVVYAPLFQAWEGDQRRDPAKVLERIQKYVAEEKGKLHGKIVLMDPMHKLDPGTEPPVQRLSEKDLSTLSQSPEPSASPSWEWPIRNLPQDPEERKKLYGVLPLEVEAEFWEYEQDIWDKLNAFLRDEGVAAALFTDRRGSGGEIFVQEGGSWHPGSPVPPPEIVVEPEQYLRMARLVERKIPVEVELEVTTDMKEGPVDGMNVVAEIPGGNKKDELVMIGGHLDSWHSGTGATDNGAGCAVSMEVMRILKTLNLPLDRTVRMALWSGEEEALYGSRYYIRKHFGDPITMKTLPEHAKLSGYFNLDNGSGKIRGVYLQGNEMMRPIFDRWLQPFRDLGVSTITIQNTGGTDHLSFDAIGLPGFQFIQDDLDYDTRTHHSNLDVYDHADPADLMQASAVMTSVVYCAANRAEMLPRKPMPKPLPPQKQ